MGLVAWNKTMEWNVGWLKADRARKNAENELHDATEHLSEVNVNIASMTSDRKRMEADIHAMQRDLDDAISSRRAAEERADKLALDLNRAQDQLRLEQDNYNNAESVRKQLEVQLREITIRLDEAESTKDGKKPLAKLQARVCWESVSYTHLTLPTNREV